MSTPELLTCPVWYEARRSMASKCLENLHPRPSGIPPSETNLFGYRDSPFIRLYWSGVGSPLRCLFHRLSRCTSLGRSSRREPLRSCCSGDRTISHVRFHGSCDQPRHSPFGKSRSAGYHPRSTGFSAQLMALCQRQESRRAGAQKPLARPDAPASVGIRGTDRLRYLQNAISDAFTIVLGSIRSQFAVRLRPDLLSLRVPSRVLVENE